MRWAAWLSIFGLAALGWAQDLTFSAKVDKTTVAVGEPISLALTLSGDISGVEFAPLEFPEGFAVVGRSQSTNFSIHAGATERSTSLVYVLIPQRPGTFQLGPFKVEQHHKEFQTEPIELTVKKSAIPPRLKPEGSRFTL